MVYPSVITQYSAARLGARPHHRALLVALSLSLSLLLLLAFLTVRHRDGSTRAPGLERSAWEVPLLDTVGLEFGGPANAESFRRMAVSVRLFHGTLPDQLALRVGYYAMVAWGVLFLLWVVYLWMVWRTRSSRVDPRFVALGAVMLSGIAFLIPPVFSTDSFSYAMFGRLADVYGANPYSTTPAETAPGDPLMSYLFWRDIPSPYGPLWTLLSQGAVSETASPLLLILRFKLISYVATLVNGWLIYRLVRRRWPDYAGWALLAFSWNPLVLVEGIVAAHNDVVLLTAALLAAHLLAHARAELSILALMLGSLIKYTIAPVMGIAALRLLIRTPPGQRSAAMTRLAASSIAIVVIAMAPYWSGADVLAGPLKQPDNGINNPLSLGLARGLESLPAGVGPVGMSTLLVLTAGSVFLVWEAWRLRRSHAAVETWTVEGELASWATSLTALLLVFPRVYTWYFLVPLGLVLVAGPAFRRQFGIILGLSLLSYVTYFN